jgi:PAS domain S-box-containing protein
MEEAEDRSTELKPWQVLFDHASDGVVLIDRDGLILDVNPAAAAILAEPRTQLQGRVLASLLSAASVVVERSEVLLPDGGSLVFLRERAVSREREAILRRSEEQYRRMTDLSPDAILVHSAGRIVYANAAFLRMVGGALDDVIGQPSLRFLHPDYVPMVKERIARVEHNVDVPMVHEKFVRFDGTSVDVEVGGLALEYEGQPAVQVIARDISERLIQQEALRRSEERYRGLVEGASETIYRITLDGFILMANPAARKILGWSDGELERMTFFELLHPDDVAIAREALKRASLGAPVNEVFRVVARDGRVVHLDTTTTPEMVDGRVVAFFGMARDISEERMAGQQVEERERLLAAVLDRLPIGVIVTDRLGIVVRSNPASDAIFGFHRTRAAVAAHSPYPAWWSDTGEEVTRDQWASTRALRSGEVTLNEVIDIERLDGVRRTILNSAIPLFDDAGHVTGAVVLNQDVTDERASERQREMMAVRLRQVISATSDGICTIDVEGRATLVNPAAAEMLGSTEEELLGADLSRIARPDADPAKEDAFRKVMREREPRPLYVDRFRTREGRAFDVEVSCAPILAGGEVLGAVITFRDVTRRNMLERDLERASRFASVGQLAATIAHEFNNVLMGILPFMEVIDRRSEHDGDLRTMVRHVQQSLQRGKQITREILKFAQAPEPEVQPVALATLFDTSIAELRAIAGRKVDVSVAPFDRTLAACIDATQIHQVLSNLVANARDAMNGEGAIVIELNRASDEEAHRLLPDVDGEVVRISVTDRGSGIDPQHLEMIFEPMFTTKRAGGTGIGLAVVQQVVRKHCGVVEVESAPGRGTTFHIYLPRCAPPDVSDSVLPVTGRGGVRSIVIVEDDENVAAGLQAVLEMEGISAHLATRGGDAEAAVERYRPDAVVLDRGLPDMDGLEVFAILNERWPELPVVFSTGHGARDDVDQLVKRTNVAYLLKPYDVSTLLEMLQEIVKK